MAESMATFAARVDRHPAAFAQGALDDIDCEPSEAHTTASEERGCEGLQNLRAGTNRPNFRSWR